MKVMTNLDTPQGLSHCENLKSYRVTVDTERLAMLTRVYVRDCMSLGLLAF